MLNIKQIYYKFLHNLPLNTDFLIFKISYLDRTFAPKSHFAFNNLPIGLKMIVFYYEYIYDLDKKRRLIQQKNIMCGIEKCKVPFGCKIYFFIGDKMDFIE